MPWHSISIHHGMPTHTLVYTRNRDFLELLVDCLASAGVVGVSEEPIEGWVCAYCDAINETTICIGCGTYSPVPMEET